MPASTPADLFIHPFRLLIAHRATIEAFVRRDIRGRYVTSVMGLSWAIIQPLALLLLYTFVFSYLLRLRFGASGSTGDFAMYLFCGMLPWLAFAEGVTRSTHVVLEHAHLIKKVVFPSEILPAYVVVSALVMEAVGLAVFLLVRLVATRELGWTLLLLPIVVLLQFLLTVGLGWLLACLNVFLRDVGQLLGLGMTLWMFLTPIFYPPEMIPDRVRWLLAANPMYHLVQAYRDLLIEQRLPHPGGIGMLTLAALAAFVIGHWAFRRSKPAFVDVL
jgi:ABC-type polysaccharide/polyol phosphate export permease